jgi:DNA-directed RNA polymerase beta subunit
LDITIENYLKLNKRTKDYLVLFKVEGINWTKKDVEMDPYLLGLWLGDGLNTGTGFALNYKTDFEILVYWEKWAEDNGAIITKGKRYNFSIISKKNKDVASIGLCNRVEEAPLKKYLRKYNLLNNKHIPNDYLTNDRETRLKVLAGLIDTDGSVRENGHEIRICQGPANYRIIEDAYTLAMSLGFSCGVKEGKSQWTDEKSGEKKFSTYKELTITGHKIYEIPTLLPRKKLAPIKNETQLLRSKSFMCSKFSLVEVGIGPYVGWQLHDKRGRFCSKDGLVLHNTPEGQSVGIVKNLAYMTHVTIYSNSLPLYEYIIPNIIPIDNNTNTLNFYDKVKVFINGSWVGITENPIELYKSLKDKKHKGIINIYTSIIFDYKLKEIRVCNDAGRLTRPLLRVIDRNILITNTIINRLKKGELVWDNLLTASKINEAVLEYIDPEEQSWSMIATKPKDLINSNNKFIKYTHCEIHPSTIFGVLASCIPFPEYNQSPRVTYQCAQAKQAMGIYATNYENRMDKTAYILNYPMRPLVETRIMDLINLNDIPSGSQVIVAIMTHTGYNQEDSLLVNKGSIDRGMALVTVYHTEKDEDKQKINGDEEIRCKPDKSKTKGMKMGNYNKVNSKGVIPENTLVENRDIIISKITPIKENKNDHTKIIKYEDQSRIYKTNEETYIDKNYIDRNGEGYNFAKVRLRTVRKPVIGDKFSSRHGQKGTVGNIIPECDMPYTDKGIRPDIIINPHAIPSRMTIGQLKETVLGKVLVELGLFGDGTSFGDFDIKDICDLLIKAGYEAHGNELLYNGLTGEQIECSIFMGPVFYQRLKHMVNDKAHSRSIGPMVNLTRQPAEGRSRDGGLRFGEMERDCMISHGAARFTRGRMYDASDKYSVYVCKKCGLIAAYNDKMHIHICKTCENRTDFAYVEIPYACKLIFQELNTMNIAPRLITEG